MCPKRKTALCLLSAAAGLGLVTAVLFCFDPSSYSFYPTCLFYKTTGRLCPGCGSLRAFHQLLHGHFAAAFRFNPLLVLSLPLCLWFVSVYASRRLRREPAPIGVSSKWIWVFAGITLAFGIWRNVPGSPFAALPQ